MDESEEVILELLDRIQKCLDEEAVSNFLSNRNITKFDVSSIAAHGVLIVYLYPEEQAELN